MEQLLQRRSVPFLTYADWRTVDAAEVARAGDGERPRVKFVTRDEFLDAIQVNRC